MESPGKKPFKIKVLPKKDRIDKKPSDPTIPHSKSKKKSKKLSRSKDTSALGLLFLGVAAFALFGIISLNFGESPKKSVEAKKEIQTNEDKKLTRYLQDAQKKSELRHLETQLENKNALPDELPAFLPLDSEGPELKRPLGVELDSDPSMAQVYDDLYGSSPSGKFMTPEERVSARLAERKWLYNFEKEERKMFVRNFIDAAKRAGYEIQINEDLVVTHVRPLVAKPKVSLDKVIENLYNPK